MNGHGRTRVWRGTVGCIRVWKSMAGNGRAWNSIEQGRKHKSDNFRLDNLSINYQSKSRLAYNLERH